MNSEIIIMQEAINNAILSTEKKYEEKMISHNCFIVFDMLSNDAFEIHDTNTLHLDCDGEKYHGNFELQIVAETAEEIYGNVQISVTQSFDGDTEFEIDELTFDVGNFSLSDEDVRNHEKSAIQWKVEEMIDTHLQTYLKY